MIFGSLATTGPSGRSAWTSPPAGHTRSLSENFQRSDFDRFCKHFLEKVRVKKRQLFEAVSRVLAFQRSELRNAQKRSTRAEPEVLRQTPRILKWNVIPAVCRRRLSIPIPIPTPSGGITEEWMFTSTSASVSASVSGLGDKCRVVMAVAAVSQYLSFIDRRAHV